MCHRHADRAWFPDVWDIPGGHIEADEDPAEALARELREELGIVVSTVGEPFAAIESESTDLSMIVYRIDSWLGAPANAAPDEHDLIEWIDVAATPSLLLADESYNDLFARAVSASTR